MGGAPRKRLHLSTIRSRYEIGESSTARPVRGQGIDYGFVSTVDAEERRQGIRDVGYGIRDTWVDPGGRLVPEISTKHRGRKRSTLAGSLLIYGDLVDSILETYGCGGGAYASARPWARSIGLSQDLIRSFRPRDHCVCNETFYRHTRQDTATSTLIQERCTAQEQMVETLRVIRDMRQEDEATWQACVVRAAERQPTLGPEAICMTWVSNQEKDDGQFVANETEKVDKYLSGLPDNIYGNVKAAKPKTLDETIELANDLMDRKLLTYAERQSDNKRKADDSSRNTMDTNSKPFKSRMSQG
ncbi:hypothetical protein Tco_0447928 [Tanacetum coccineum]